MLEDAEGNEIGVGSDVAFYLSEAQVKRGTIAKISQTVWESRQVPQSGTLHICMEPGGTKYKRRSDAVIALPPKQTP